MWRLLITLAIVLQWAVPGHVSIARVAIEREAVAMAPAPRLPAGARLLGPVPGDQPLRLVIGLAPRYPGLLDDYARARASGRDAAGALTAAAFGRLFGPSSADQDAVVGYLSSHGLGVVRAYPDHLLLDVAGTAAQVSAAFGVPLARYQGRDGHAHDMNMAAPRLPAHLARLVDAVVGLRDDGAPYRPLLDRRASRARLLGHVRRVPSARIGARDSAPPAGLLTPANIRAAYDITPVYTRTISTDDGQTTAISNTGTGQTIALFELAPYDLADIAAYDSAFGLTATAPASVSVDGGATNAYGYFGRLEASLDIELAQAVAPGARILVYSGPSSPTATDLTQADDTYARIVNDDQAQVLSTSWGQCEAAQQADQPPDLLLVHNLLAQAVAEGMTVLAATGDQGAYDCSTPSGAVDYAAPAVDYPASDSLALAVGGTTVQLDANGGVAAESGWAGSGGGLSAVFTRPAWQVGPGVSNALSNGMRQIPDVAMDAGRGYAIWANGGWNSASGTSAGPPLWSGLLALTNEARYSSVWSQGAPPLSCAAARGLGDIHDELYKLGGTAAYRDIMDGPSNGLAGPSPGWDYVTGWGVPDANVLVHALIAAPALALAAPDPCPSPTSTSTPAPTSTATALPMSTPTTIPMSTSTAIPTDTAQPAAVSPTATVIAPATPTGTATHVPTATATPTITPAATSPTATTTATGTTTAVPAGSPTGASTATATPDGGSTGPRPRPTPTKRPTRLMVALFARRAHGEVRVRALLHWVAHARISLAFSIDGRGPWRAVLRADAHGAATYVFHLRLAPRGPHRRARLVLRASGLTAHTRATGVARLTLAG